MKTCGDTGKAGKETGIGTATMTGEIGMKSGEATVIAMITGKDTEEETGIKALLA